MPEIRFKIAQAVAGGGGGREQGQLCADNG